MDSSGWNRMPKTKKEEKIDLVRKILDNPNEFTPSTSDRYVEALRLRLVHQQRYHIQKDTSMGRHTPQLTPTVHIHHEIKQERSIMDDQKIYQTRSDKKDTPQSESSFYQKGEDIFEIERVSAYEIPDFIEVKPKDQVITHQAKQQSPITEIIKKEETESLPKWELVEENLETKQEPIDKKEEQPQKYQKQIWKDEEIETTQLQTEDDDQPIWEPIMIKKEKRHLIKKKPLFKRITPKNIDERPAEKYTKFHVKDLKKSLHKIQEKDKKIPYTFKGYTLYQKEIDLGNNKKRVIHFFSKDEPEEATPSGLPEDYEVRINKKTSVPYIRKKQ